MAIDHAAQAAKVKAAMQSSGYAVVYHSGGRMDEPNAASSSYDATGRDLGQAEQMAAARKGMNPSGRPAEPNGTAKIL